MADPEGDGTVSEEAELVVRLESAASKVLRLEKALAAKRKKLSTPKPSDGTIHEQLAAVSLSVSRLSRDNQLLREENSAMIQSAEHHSSYEAQRGFLNARVSELMKQREGAERRIQLIRSEIATLEHSNGLLCEEIAGGLSNEQYTEQELCVLL